MGEWDVDRLLRRMPAHVFAEWRAYDRISPIGGERDDSLHAMLVHEMRMLWSMKYRGSPPDHLPPWHSEKPTRRRRRTARTHRASASEIKGVFDALRQHMKQ